MKKLDAFHAIIALFAALLVIGFILKWSQLPQKEPTTKQTATYTAPQATQTEVVAPSIKPKATTTKPKVSLPSKKVVTDTTINVQNTFDLVNNERIDKGLQPLIMNTKLIQSAQAKLAYMIANKDFSHDLINGKMNTTYIQASGYQYKKTAENLAQGYNTVQDMVNAWINSKLGHEQNIVDPIYTETGIAIGQGVYQGNQVTYAVQYFALPLK